MYNPLQIYVYNRNQSVPAGYHRTRHFSVSLGIHPRYDSLLIPRAGADSPGKGGSTLPDDPNNWLGPELCCPPSYELEGNDSLGPRPCSYPRGANMPPSPR
jgi:hypothetical protein